MRSGVKSMAGAYKAHPAAEPDAPPTRAVRIRNLVGHILTVAAVLAAAGIMLHRCGVIQF
jgi:hypothetical protein